MSVLSNNMQLSMIHMHRVDSNIVWKFRVVNCQWDRFLRLCSSIKFIVAQMVSTTSLTKDFCLQNLEMLFMGFLPQAESFLKDWLKAILCRFSILFFCFSAFLVWFYFDFSLLFFVVSLLSHLLVYWATQTQDWDFNYCWSYDISFVCWLIYDRDPCSLP
jgi:hypothetical protein